MRQKKLAPALIILATVAINFAFGFPRLTSYSAVDEHLWTYGRIPRFWSAIASHKWKNTDINDKPGVTVALISGVGLLDINPKPYSALREGDGFKTEEQIAAMKTISFDFRLPLYVFTLLMASVFYFLLKKLLNETIALFSIIMIYLSPVLLGISLIINPDSLLWTFVPLSILGFLVFQKTFEHKYAYLSGLFLGLALLTKYVATIAYPFFFFLILADYVFAEKKENGEKYFRKSLIGYGIVLLISTLTVLALYPATWASAKHLLATTFLTQSFKPFFPVLGGSVMLLLIDTFTFKSRFMMYVLAPLVRYKKASVRLISFLFAAAVMFILINTYSGMPFYDFQSMLTLAKFKQDALLIFKIFLDGGLSGTYILLFSLTPVVFLFFAYSIFSNLAKRIEFAKDTVLPVFYLLVFILLYYGAFAVSNVYPSVRYQISVYPLASIIAAIGLYRFISLERIKRYAPLMGVYFLLVIASAFSLWQIRPYYFAYASALLPNRYVLYLNDMGDGSYEAAQYLNTIPDAQNLTIWSDKVAVCEFFVGRCKISLLGRNLSGPYFDYFVVSSPRQARTKYVMQKREITRGREFEKIQSIYASDNASDYKIVIDHRPDDFVKVVKNPESK